MVDDEIQPVAGRYKKVSESRSCQLGVGEHEINESRL